MKPFVLTTFLFFIFYSSLISQEPFAELNPVVIESSSAANRAVFVDLKSFELQQTSGLSDALSGSMSSVSLVRRAGAANDVILEGLFQDNISVLNDGRKVYAACLNRMDPPISHVCQTQLESIEIESGAFDLKYSGSLGGKINVNTRAIPDAFNLSSSVLWGSFSREQYSLSLSYGGPVFSSSVFASYQQGDPYEDADGRRITDMPEENTWALDDYQEKYKSAKAYEKQNYMLKSQFEWSENQSIAFSFQWNDDNNVLYPALRMDSEHNRTEQYGLLYTYSNPRSLIKELKADFYYNSVEHDMTDSRRISALETPTGMSRGQYVLERGYYMRTFAKTEVRGLRFDFQSEYKDHNLEYGIDMHQRYWDADNSLGAGANESQEILNNMVPGVTTDNYGIYFQGAREYGPWQLDYGLRYDRYETEASDSVAFLESQKPGVGDIEDDSLGGKIALYYNVSEEWKLWAALGHVQRSPNAQERYLNLQRPGSMPNWIGNPDLEMVKNTEFRIGTHYSSGALEFQIESFIKQIDEYIYPLALSPSDESNLSKNAQSYTGIDAEIYGVNFDLSYAITEHWAFSSSVSYLRGEKKDDVLNNDNDVLGELPPLRLISSVNYENKNYLLSLQIEAADEQDRIDEAIGESEIDSYCIFNFRMRYEITDSAELQLGVDNLFDEDYILQNAYVRNPFSSYSLISEPGRNYFIALNYKFSK